MPIGLAPKHENGAQGLAIGGLRYTPSFGIEDSKPERWSESYGIMIYTGIPSERDGAQWHDIDFTYEAICAAPDAVIACVAVAHLHEAEHQQQTILNPLKLKPKMNRHA